jgi:hypothetical protein
MKTLLAIAVLSLGLSAQADATKKPATHSTTPAATTAHKSETKMSAKDACLKENPKLTGAELDNCVKEKEKATK